MKYYVAFYDMEDDGSRENWSVFYTPFVVSTDQNQARAEAEAKVKEIAIERVIDDYGDKYTQEDLAEMIGMYAVVVKEYDDSE